MEIKMKDERPIEILDIIVHHHQFGWQYMVVLNRYPEYLFEKRSNGNLLVANDSGFIKAYRYERPSPRWKAFAGREFDIPMVDGSAIRAYGQWWDTYLEEMRSTISAGYNTESGLAKCSVYYSGHIPSKLFNEWLTFNNPSNNSRKYDRRSKLYGIHRIQSKWEKR